MLGPIGADNLKEHLTAFADGELDAAQILQVLDHLAEHPGESLELIRSQQKLRLAALRAVRAQTPPVPAALRERIERMAEARATGGSPEVVGRSAWRQRLLVPVAAGLMLCGILLGRWLFPAPPSQVVQVTPPLPVVPVTLVGHALRVHADCSRLAAELHAGGYPREMGGLADAVRKDLGGANPYPDFSAIGYRYIGAGPCGAPLTDTIHLLYYSTGNGPRSAISVFVQPNRGQFEMREGTLYLLSDARSPFPTYGWRTSEVVYFLIADSPAIADAARTAISGIPTSLK